jgi:hypothetical protein
MFYTPPEGYIDQPFFWCYDTDDVSDATSPYNIAVNLPGGYDFILRRITGVNSVLNPATGGFTVRVGNRVRQLASGVLVNPLKLADWLLACEITYPESGAISFDLYNTLKQSLPSSEGAIPYGQIAYQGVRRRKGQDSTLPGRRFRRMPFHLVLPIDLNWSYFSTQRARRFSFVVDNFDYEMHGVFWTVDVPGIIEFHFEPATDLYFTQLALGSIASLVVVNSAPNQVLGVTVLGQVVTLTIATNGGGAETSSLAQVKAAMDAVPAAAALFATTIVGDPTLTAGIPDGPYAATTTYGQTIEQASAFAGGMAKFVLYDYAKNGLMPVPMRIEYLNEPLPYGSVGTYKSGALLPVLVYPKDSAIAVDIVSLIPTGPAYRLNLNVLGMQRQPC